METPRPQSFLTLADAVADGRPVDWVDAEASATTFEDRQALDRLRVFADVRAAAQQLQPTWGTLEIRSEIGRGTFGVVYRAWDPKLEREVALKLLHAGSTAAAQVAIQEGRLLARLRHPNVVTVYGADELDGRPGIWMEFVEGRTLAALVEDQGPLDARTAASITRDVCRAVAAVHAEGILHRDIKAQNVMLEPDGRTVLMDFGAGDLGDERRAVLRGTPLYLAPELLAGAPASVASDLYSIGVLLHLLLTARYPVEASSLDDLRRAHESRHPGWPGHPEIPPALMPTVERLLSAAPEDRPQANDVALALDTFLHPGPSAAGRALRGGLMAIGVVSVAGFAWWANSIAGSAAANDDRAFALYVRGLDHAKDRSADSLNESIRLYQEALTLAPEFARAHAGIADAYTVLGVYGAIPRRTAYARAAEHAEHAVSIDPNLWEVHRSLGYIRKNAFDWRGAEASFRTALAVNAQDALTHHWYSVLLTQLKRLDEASAEIALALSLDPSSTAARLQRASLFTMKYRFDDAIADYDAVIESLGGGVIAPPVVCGQPAARTQSASLLSLARRHRAFAYALRGDTDTAARMLRDLSCESLGGQEDQETKTDLAWVLATAGDHREALRIVDELIRRYDLANEDVAAAIAQVLIPLGRIDEAFFWLTRAVEGREAGVGYLKVNPRWDSLRTDSRFEALLKQLALSDP